MSTLKAKKAAGNLTRQSRPKKPLPTRATTATKSAASADKSSSALSGPEALSQEVHGNWTVNFLGLGELPNLYDPKKTSGEYDACGAMPIARLAAIVFSALTGRGIAANVFDSLELVSLDPLARAATVRLKSGAATLWLGNRFRAIATNDSTMEEYARIPADELPYSRSRRYW